MIALCQDCLRVVDMDREVYEAGAGMGACQCGGDVCDCQSCMWCLRGLYEGCRDPKLLHLEKVGPGFEWSPGGGVAD